MAVGGSAGQNAPVFGDEFTQLSVEDPRVVSGGQRRIGLARQRVGDLLGPVALVGDDPTVIDHRHPGGVPGVGGPAGAGLAGVAAVGVEGRAAEQVTGLPGAPLGAVDGSRPGVGQVGCSVFPGTGHESSRKQPLLTGAAIEAN